MVRNVLISILLVTNLIAFNNCGTSVESTSSQPEKNSEATGPNRQPLSTSPYNPTENERFKIEALKYAGAFRLESGSHGNVDYATGTIAYNSDHNSIYVAGFEVEHKIGEFKVPNLSRSSNVSELTSAESVNPFRDVISEASEGNPARVNRVTGMFYEKNQLFINNEIWYDAPGNNKSTSLVLRDTKNFSTSVVHGFFNLEGQAQSAGYVSAVPVEWQQRLDSQYITGWSSNYSIISRYSVGPSMHSVSLENLLSNPNKKSGFIPTSAHMNFPYSEGQENTMLDRDALSMTPGKASALYNFLSRAVYGFIVPGTSTFAVFGSSGGIDSGIGYKITQSGGQVCSGHCSYDPKDNYNYYWLFDLNEILSSDRPSKPRPYAFGKLPVPFDNNGLNRILGGTFDPLKSRLYLSIENAGQISNYDRPPVIVVYEIE